MTHTLARTMEWLRKEGFEVEKVEQAWNQYTRKRRDLFHIIDAIAIKKDDPVTIGVQACATGELSAHEKKIRSSPYFETWLSSPYRMILLVGWSKRSARGKDGKKLKVKRWTPKSYYVTL